MRALTRVSAAILCAFALAAATSARAPEDPAGTLSMQPESLLQCLPGAEECELGDLAADAVRLETGADAALVPADALQNDLPAGSLTWADVTAAVAEAPLAAATLTPAELYTLLEHALSHLVIDRERERLLPEQSAWDGFVQIAGFSLICDASAPAGERVYRVTLPDGTRLSREDTEPRLTVVSTEALLSGGYGGSAVEYQPLSLTLADALADHLSKTEVTAIETGRIRFIGTGDSALVRAIPGWALIAVLALIALSCIFFRGKERAAKPFRPIEEGETRKPY